MAQTMSEFEKERAQLLKAIESQAQQISSTRSDEGSDSGHSLKDWLSAAEEVMPNKSQSQAASNSASASSTQDSVTNSSNPKPRGSKTSFFGVIILLSLLLTILGVLYIAYTTINKELEEVKAVKQEGQTESQELQATVEALQKSVASGGTPVLFNQLESRVADLEAQLSVIQKQQQALLAKLDDQVAAFKNQGGEGMSARPHDQVPSSQSQVVTESILDQKLKVYTSQLEERIDQKLERILQHLSQQPGGQALKQEVMKKEAKSEPIAETVQPEEPKVEVPRVKQPIVKLVEPVEAPQVQAVKQPAQAYTADAKWLLEQPAQHYVLQLASMTEKQALQSMIRQKGLNETRIVLQKRPSGERYVLITGSYASKSDANARASLIKSQYGISPWVRKMKDLTSKMP